MAGNTEHVDNEIRPERSLNLPELLSKTVDDLSRIVQTEIGLLRLTLQQVLEAETDRIIGMLGLLVAAAYGSLFLLGGIMLLIHLWLAWWAAFLVTGAAVTAVGVLLLLLMLSRARAKSASIHTA